LRPRSARARRSRFVNMLEPLSGRAALGEPLGDAETLAKPVKMS